jgi:hypothetical protein
VPRNIAGRSVFAARSDGLAKRTEPQLVPDRGKLPVIGQYRISIFPE